MSVFVPKGKNAEKGVVGEPYKIGSPTLLLPSLQLLRITPLPCNMFIIVAKRHYTDIQRRDFTVKTHNSQIVHKSLRKRHLIAIKWKAATQWLIASLPVVAGPGPFLTALRGRKGLRRSTAVAPRARHV